MIGQVHTCHRQRHPIVELVPPQPGVEAKLVRRLAPPQEFDLPASLDVQQVDHKIEVLLVEPSLGLAEGLLFTQPHSDHPVAAAGLFCDEFQAAVDVGPDLGLGIVLTQQPHRGQRAHEVPQTIQTHHRDPVDVLAGGGLTHRKRPAELPVLDHPPGLREPFSELWRGDRHPQCSSR